MKYLFSVIFLTLLISGYSQEKVQIGAKEKYYLSADEKNLTIDDKILENYDPYNNNLEHQVPLQKYIKAPNYILYVGLAISNTSDETFDLYVADTLNYSILETSIVLVKKDVFYKIFCKYNGEYNYKIIFKTKKSHYTVVLNYVSNNRELLRSFYDDEDFFKKKLNKKVKK